MKGREKNMLHGNHSARVKNISYFLDKYPRSVCAYSLRRLRKDYTGPLIRIDVGGVKTDIFSKHDTITGLDYVDWSHIQQLYPNSAVVVDTWYDQSGNGFHATGTSGPDIKLSNSVPFSQQGDNRFPFYNLNGFIGLGANTSRRLINTSINQSTPITFFTVQSIGSARQSGVVFDSYNASQCVLYNTGLVETPNYRYTIANGVNIKNSKEIVGAQMNLTAGVIGGSSHLGIDRGYGNNAAFSTNSLNGISLFNLRGNPNPISAAYPWTGVIYEVIIYPGNLQDKISIMKEDIIRTYKLNSVMNGRAF